MTRFGPYLTTGPGGQLLVENVSAVALAETYGTPLYVFSENTLRSNFRMIRDAFHRHYPGRQWFWSTKPGRR